MFELLKLKGEIRLRRPPGQISKPFVLKNDETYFFSKEKFVSIARRGKFPSHFGSKTMKNYFKQEIHKNRPRGQVSHPCLLHNNEKVMFKREIHRNRPRGQISHPCLLKNNEKVIFKKEIRLHRLPGQISQPFLVKNAQKVIKTLSSKEKFTGVARRGKFPNHFCSKTMKK